jgi:hypothetical protein
VGVQRNTSGPLRFSKLIQYIDCFFWDKTRPPPVEALDSDEPHIVRMTDRSDLLSSRYLKTTRAAHLIMERNGLRLWPNDFVPGLKIMIPTRASLEDRGLL